MISDDVREGLHQQLLADKRRLDAEIANLRGEGVSSEAFGADEGQDSVDQHPADAGSEMFEREKNLTVLGTLEISQREVQEALGKFEAGTYGTCENCGKPIGEKRLRAFPSAIHCIDCQSKLEKQGHRTLR